MNLLNDNMIKITTMGSIRIPHDSRIIKDFYFVIKEKSIILESPSFINHCYPYLYCFTPLNYSDLEIISRMVWNDNKIEESHYLSSIIYSLRSIIKSQGSKSES